MKYKLAISDFDGTLLRRDDTVTERTVKAVRAFEAKGGIFGVSTGRAFSSIRQRLSEVGLVGNFPVMCCQGALTSDSETGEPITEIGMDRRSAAEFLRRAAAEGLTCQFYTAKKVYANKLNDINRYYFSRNRILPEEIGEKDIARAALDCPDAVLKVLCFVDENSRSRAPRIFGDIPGIKTFTSNPHLYEGVSVDAGKENGLRLVCKRLGIDISECAAFGDERNDAAMLEAAGLGVAVGNALDEVKAVADYVTDSNENDGVAKVLELIADGKL